MKIISLKFYLSITPDFLINFLSIYDNLMSHHVPGPPDYDVVMTEQVSGPKEPKLLGRHMPSIPYRGNHHSNDMIHHGQ